MPAPQPAQKSFYDSIPVFQRFPGVIDASLYRPVPDDWIIGLSDVTGSTRAIEAGKYKAVNMAGAAVIAAVSNALGNRIFPFVFGGDGTSFAVAPADGSAARDALAKTRVWVREALDLDLRVGATDVASIRAAGHDVRIARFAASQHLNYAMFSGGGLAYAEDRLKQGDYTIAPAGPGEAPDLTGLSCRWEPISPAHDTILSLIVIPSRGEADPAFHRLVEEIVAMSADPAEAARPVSTATLRTKWPPSGLTMEARTLLGSRALNKFKMGVHTLLAFLIFKSGRKAGAFDPALYLRQTVDNSDFRKYGDGLRMTLDCTDALVARVRARLEAALAQGTANYGLHQQKSALMTCVVPSVFNADHFHFIDGAEGGYATAARDLKGRVVAGG